MMGDPTTPVQALQPATTQTVLIVAMSVAAAAVWSYAIAESRRRRDLVPVFVVIGAGLAIFYEPIGDALVKVYYPERGQETWIHAFGRDIPAYIGILYFWYMPVGALWLLRASRRGVSARQWWARWAGFIAFASIFEMLVLELGGTTWIYHDRQPFAVLGVPVLTTADYVSFVVAIAAGATALARVLPRRQQWLIVPAVPMLMAGSHMATALPDGLALHGTDSLFLRDLGAVGSAAFAAILSHLCSLPFRRPWPADGPDADHAAAADVEPAARRPVAV